MTSKQEDKYGMFLKVDFYLVQQALLLAFNPAIAATRTVINSFINAIAQADSTATRDISGFTVAKNQHRVAILDLFKIVRAGLMGYYTGNLDPRKKLVIDFTDADIDRFRDADLYIKTDQLLDIALPIKAMLVPSGVTAAQVDALDTLNQGWPALEPSSRMEEAVNIAFRKDVTGLVEKTDTLLDDTLDSYMKIVQYNNPNLYSQYQTGRMIDDSGGGSDSAGYEVITITVPAGGSVIFPIGAPGIPGNLELYLRAINGSAYICSTNLPASPCAGGYEMLQGVTFKGVITPLMLDLTKTHIQFTNPGLTDVIVRAGTKEE